MAFSISCILSILLWIMCCECYLDTLYTSSDENYLSTLIKSSQDDKSGLFEKSITTTHYAIEALSITNKGSIPKNDKLCSSLKAYKISSWEEFHNLLVARSQLNHCLDSIKDTSLKKLRDGQSANKLSKVYYSINGIYTLSNTDPKLYDTTTLNLVDILSHIKTFQLSNKLFTEQVKSSKSKSSIHKSSMALYAVAKLLTLPNLTEAQKESLQSDEVKKLLTSFMSTANALIKDYSKINENMISYSNSLTATAVVLESINEFVNALQSIPSIADISGQFTKFNDNKYLENVVRYILTFRSTTSPTSARHVVILMNMIKTSDLFKQSRPISIRVNNQIFNDVEGKKKEKALTLSITDVYGNKVLASNEATSVKIESSKETSTKKEGPLGAFKAKGDGQYVFPFGTEIRKLSFDDGPHGVYKLKINVLDENIKDALTIQTSVKVTTSLNKAVFGIQYSKKSDEGYNRVTYPDLVKETYDVSPSQKVKLEIQVKSVQKPSQIVIEFIDSEGDSVLQIVPKTRQEKYGITIDLNKASFSGLTEGEYKLNMIIGNALYRKSLQWTNIVTLNIIEEEDEAEVDYEPVNDETPPFKPKTNIEHTFGGKEAEPMVIFPLIFCGVVALPLLYFIYHIFVSMATTITFERDVQLSSLFFIVTLSGIGAILFLYWWQWNIFEAGGWLTMASIPAFFFGYNVLKNHLLLRTGTKQTKQH